MTQCKQPMAQHKTKVMVAIHRASAPAPCQGFFVAGSHGSHRLAFLTTNLTLSPPLLLVHSAESEEGTPEAARLHMTSQPRFVAELAGASSSAAAEAGTAGGAQAQALPSSSPSGSTVGRAHSPESSMPGAGRTRQVLAQRMLALLSQQPSQQMPLCQPGLAFCQPYGPKPQLLLDHLLLPPHALQPDPPLGPDAQVSMASGFSSHERLGVRLYFGHCPPAFAPTSSLIILQPCKQC